MENNFVIKRNEKKKTNKLKWGTTLIVAGLMSLTSCVSTSVVKNKESASYSVRDNKTIFQHLVDINEIEKLKDKDRFETGTISFFFINFGKSTKKVSNYDDDNIYRDYFSIKNLDHPYNPLNPEKLRVKDPLLYKVLTQQVSIYNYNNPSDKIDIKDLILKYIDFFGFDILDKIKDGEIKFEKVKGNI